MHPFKIVTGGRVDDLDEERHGLGDLPVEFVTVPESEDDFIAVARDADAILARGLKLTARVIGALEKCRVIAGNGVGVDFADIAAATAAGIPVTNVPDIFIEEVADHLMMMLLCTFRDTLEQDRLVREGRWREGRTPLLQIPRLMGQTLGLIGFGHIPRAVAARAKPFGLIVKAYDPFIEELVMVERGVLPCTLADVMGCDFVSNHLPGTPETRQFVKEHHFRAMKPTAWFLNVGRGGTVDEAALIRALSEGWIRGAGLDVLAEEPPRQDNPILQMKNVILSAHTASASQRSEQLRRRRAGQEIALALQGKWPMSCVNPTVLPALAARRWQPISMERGPNS
jgi:D-3-phosphoglycerate dehydrogenase